MPAAPGRLVPLVLLAAVAALAVLLAALREEPPAPAPVLPVDAALTLVPDDVSVTQSGVLVVPVLLRDRGPGLTVVDATAYAEPVRDDPAASPPQTVAPGQARRFVVLLAPDCRLLTPRSGLQFRASLLVRVASAGAEQQLVLPLGDTPAVADRVAGLCRRDPAASPGLIGG